MSSFSTTGNYTWSNYNTNITTTTGGEWNQTTTSIIGKTNTFNSNTYSIDSFPKLLNPFDRFLREADNPGQLHLELESSDEEMFAGFTWLSGIGPLNQGQLRGGPLVVMYRANIWIVEVHPDDVKVLKKRWVEKLKQVRERLYQPDPNSGIVVVPELTPRQVVLTYVKDGKPRVTALNAVIRKIFTGGVTEEGFKAKVLKPYPVFVDYICKGGLVLQRTMTFPNTGKIKTKFQYLPWTRIEDDIKSLLHSELEKLVVQTKQCLLDLGSNLDLFGDLPMTSDLWSVVVPHYQGQFDKQLRTRLSEKLFGKRLTKKSPKLAWKLTREYLSRPRWEKIDVMRRVFCHLLNDLSQIDTVTSFWGSLAGSAIPSLLKEHREILQFIRSQRIPTSEFRWIAEILRMYDPKYAHLIRGNSLRRIHDELTAEIEIENLKISEQKEKELVDRYLATARLLPYEVRIWYNALLSCGFKVKLPTCPKEVAHWGQLQGHCIGTYIHEHGKDCILIQADEPDGERTHIQFKLNDGAWVVRQWYRKRNRNVPEYLKERVKRRAELALCDAS